AVTVLNDPPPGQRQADAWIEPEGPRTPEFADDRRAIGHPHVAGVVLHHAVDVGGRTVDEVQAGAVVAIESAFARRPQPAGAILVDAERLFAVVAVGLGEPRPAVAGEAEQPADRRGPHRAAPILEQRVHAGRRAFGRGVVGDAAGMDAGDALAAKAGPDAALRRRAERRREASRRGAGAAVLGPALESGAVES